MPKKCKGCKTKIEEMYEYCFSCNEKLGNEIKTGNTLLYLKKKLGDEKKCPKCGTDLNIHYTPLPDHSFYMLKVIEKFRHPDEITLKSTKDKLHITDQLVKDLSHMGVEEIDKRRWVKETSGRREGKFEVNQAFIELIAPLKGLKRELKRKGLLD